MSPCASLPVTPSGTTIRVPRQWPNGALALALALFASLWSPPALADRDERDDRGRERGGFQQRAPAAQEQRRDDRREDRRDDRRDNRRDDRHDDRREHRRDDRHHWWDGAYGHNRDYPRPGWTVVTPPPRTRIVYWGGVGYHYGDGIWYSRGSHGYVVVRPPLGVVVMDLPSFATAVVLGGLTYYYVNGVYYRRHPDSGYEVVQAPVAQPDAAASDRTFVYPRQGQSAEQQASDEYECHRWAVGQSGFDPTDTATATAAGQADGSAYVRRGDYQRARVACLEGRGYTVR